MGLGCLNENLDNVQPKRNTAVNFWRSELGNTMAFACKTLIKNGRQMKSK